MKKISLSFTSESTEETKKIGGDLAKIITSLPPLNHARIIDLKGTLGAGKTTLTKGFVSGLGIKTLATSPTFVLMHRFPIKTGYYKNLFHIDAYRLSSFSELVNLGIEELISDSHNIILIEWKKNANSKKMKLCGSVSLRHKTEYTRSISITINK